jgi:hypothetical protein
MYLAVSSIKYERFLGFNAHIMVKILEIYHRTVTICLIASLGIANNPGIY